MFSITLTFWTFFFKLLFKLLSPYKISCLLANTDNQYTGLFQLVRSLQIWYSQRYFCRDMLSNTKTNLYVQYQIFSSFTKKIPQVSEIPIFIDTERDIDIYVPDIPMSPIQHLSYICEERYKPFKLLIHIYFSLNKSKVVTISGLKGETLWYTDK